MLLSPSPIVAQTVIPSGHAGDCSPNPSGPSSRLSGASRYHLTTDSCLFACLSPTSVGPAHGERTNGLSLPLSLDLFPLVKRNNDAGASSASLATELVEKLRVLVTKALHSILLPHSLGVRCAAGSSAAKKRVLNQGRCRHLLVKRQATVASPHLLSSTADTSMISVTKVIAFLRA